jgi:hypothetical protein
MAKKKVSVTMDEEVVSAIHGAVGGRGFSAFVNEAARAELQARRLERLLDDLDDQFGPVPENVQEAANAMEWPAPE